MSYCVNCGVELEASLAACPLCSTPVINPKETGRHAVSPYPKEKAPVEPISQSDWSILLSTTLLSTSITCGLLNLLVFKSWLWSVPIIGICIVVWVFSVPFLIYKKLPMPVSFLLDGCVTGAYLCLITLLTESNGWLWEIGLPITAMATVLVELFWFLFKNVSSAFLATALYIFAEAGVLCVGVEIILDRAFDSAIHLSWSAVTLTVCAIICTTLVTALSRKRVRNSVRKRLHF